MPNIKTLVLDDCNYLLSEETMSRAFEKGYDKHNEIANHYYYFILNSMTLRDDLNVLFISHLMNDGTDIDPHYKLYTVGKMLDTKVNIDGLFNYIIYAEKLDNGGDDPDFKFRTRPGVNDTCRSTFGCFEEKYIEPNAKLVIDTINNFENGEK